ncbi:MAG TPA: hypothetical protein VGK82_19120, partial [Pyrinomonadaceae bacterium]
MSTSATDLAIGDIITAADPQTIGEVIEMMTAIDAVLPGSDGLKWFNWLYLTVTKGVQSDPATAGF